MLIDLDARPGAPVRQSPSRFRLRAGLAVASALLLGGAAAPAPGPLLVVTVDSRVSVPVVPLGDAVYTADPRGAIQAVPLRPGGPEWTVDTGGTESFVFRHGAWLVATT